MPKVGSSSGSVLQRVAGEPCGVAARPEDGRREVRYAVTGDAEIILKEGVSMFRGRILNISNTGCYVRTVAPKRLARGTPAELVLTVKGRVIQILAEVRFSKLKTGNGFRFVGMTDEIRATLCEVIQAAQAQSEGEEEAAPRTVWHDTV